MAFPQQQRARTMREIKSDRFIVLGFLILAASVAGCAGATVNRLNQTGAVAIRNDDPRQLIEYFYEFEKVMPDHPELSEEKLEKQLAAATKKHPKNWEFHAFRASQFHRLGRHNAAAAKHEEARVWWTCDEYFRKSIAQTTTNVVFVGLLSPALAAIDNAIPDDHLEFPEKPGAETWTLDDESRGWMKLGGTPYHEPEADCSGRLYPKKRKGRCRGGDCFLGDGWDEVAAVNAEYRRENPKPTPIITPRPTPKPTPRGLRQQGEECAKDSDCDIGMMCREYACVTPSEWRGRE